MARVKGRWYPTPSRLGHDACLYVITDSVRLTHREDLRFSVWSSRGFPPLGCDSALLFEGMNLRHQKGFGST
jgi:hypothetical protein